MNKLLDCVFYFFFYSGLGWLIESIYCSVPARKWINRGFLKGPLCPIYGTGATVMMICLMPLKSIAGDRWYLNLLFVFVAGMILCDIVEFITSVLMEKLFHARWWDYSGKRFNIQGRICLTHTFYWGIASSAFIFIAHPLITKLFGLFMTDTLRNYFLLLEFAVFLIDLGNTLRSALAFRKFSQKLQKLSDDIAAVAEQVYSAVGTRAKDIQLDITRIGSKKLTEWSEDVSIQLSNAQSQFESLAIPGKLRLYKPVRHLMRSFPYLEKGVKEQLKLLNDITDEIKDRITDENEEMF